MREASNWEGKEQRWQSQTLLNATQRKGKRHWAQTKEQSIPFKQEKKKKAFLL